MSRRPCVLIVDDDLKFLRVTAEQLRPSCAAVFVARTPLSAVWVLETEAIDVIICDLRLSLSDGRHLLGSVRAGWPHVARILVTGFGDDVLRPGTFPEAQAVVLKPVDGAALADLVRHLGRVPARRVRDVDLSALARLRTNRRAVVGESDTDGDSDPDPG